MWWEEGFEDPRKYQLWVTHILFYLYPFSLIENFQQPIVGLPLYPSWDGPNPFREAVTSRVIFQSPLLFIVHMH